MYKCPEKELFNLFQAYNKTEKYELYKRTASFIEEEVKKEIVKQISERREFVLTMDNRINNAGWDDKKKNSKTIDMIFKEEHKIHDIMEECGIDE